MDGLWLSCDGLLQASRTQLLMLAISITSFLLYFSWYLTQDFRARLYKEPPCVPHAIPWLGHALRFFRSNNDFVEYLKRCRPSSPIVSVTLAGRRMYIIVDAHLASIVYRQSRTYAFDPFVLLVCRAFGSSAADIKVLEVGAHDVSRQRQQHAQRQKQSQQQQQQLDEHAGPSPPGILHALHTLSVTHLRGTSLDRMTAVFNEQMFVMIDDLFPEADEASYAWRTLDLVEFVKRAWMISSCVSLFGSKIVERWEGVNEWLWNFDDHALPLFALLPRFVVPKSYALREEGLRQMENWEAMAKQADADGLAMNGESEWDPYWGLHFLRVRAKMAEDVGIDPRGRAALQLAFLWGQNTNAIPVAVWTMIQAIHSPGLMSKVRSEAVTAKDGTSSLDMPKLHLQRRLKSLLLETYRWAVSSPALRVIQKDTELAGYQLQAGSLVVVSARSLQMDQQIWQRSQAPHILAAEFDPERFLDSNEASFEEQRAVEAAEAEKNYLEGEQMTSTKSVSRDIFSTTNKDLQKKMLALRPFGGGQTLCPGRHFATNEILGGVAAMMLRLDFEIDQDALKRVGFPKPNMAKQGGLLPDRKYMVRVRRRRAVAEDKCE